MRTPAEKIALTVGLLCGVIAAVTPHVVVPQFHEVFKSFGADLPLITRLVVGYYPAIWLLPAAVVAAWFFWPRPRRRALTACLIGILGLVLVIPVLVGAMYLPIFKLAAVS